MSEIKLLDTILLHFQLSNSAFIILSIIYINFLVVFDFTITLFERLKS
jgi:hypothetical protein